MSESIVAEGKIHNPSIHSEAGSQNLCLTGSLDLSEATWASWTVPGVIDISVSAYRAKTYLDGS